MSAQFDSTPGLHLPQPTVTNAVPATPVAIAPAVAANAPQPLPPQPIPVPQSQPINLQPAATPVISQPAPEESSGKKDEDMIDDEWALKARDTIEQYKDDPYTLSVKLSSLRANYLKERHGIVMKVSDQ